MFDKKTMIIWIIKNKINLLFLFFVFTKGVVWILITPPFLFPDEPAHFAYTQYLIEEKNIPKNDGALSPDLLSKSEELDAAVKIVKEDFRIWSTDPINFKKDVPQNNLENFSSYSRKVEKENYKNAAAIYPPLYYAFEAISYLIGYSLDIFHRVYLMRFASLIFLIITIVYAYKIAFLATKNKKFAYTVAGIITLIPSLNIISFGTINNDAVLIALSHIMLYYLFKVLDAYPSTIKKIIQGGALLGLTLLTKPQAIIFIPLTIGVFLYAGRKFKKTKLIFSDLFILFFTAGVIAVPFLLLPVLNYSNALTDQLIIASSGESFKTVPDLVALISNDIIRRTAVATTFWAEFFHNQSSLRLYMEIAVTTLSILSFFGLVCSFTNMIKKKIYNYWVIFCLLSVLPLEILYTLLYYQNAIIKQYYDFPGQGRYYYLLAAPIIMLFVFSFEKFLSLFKIPPRYAYAGLIFFFVIFHNLALINLAPY